LRRGSLDRSESVSRDEYFLVQTPQCFDSTLLRRAYRQEFRNEFTDDASVVERSGQPIQLVEGEFNNIKITYPDDFRIAELLLTDKKWQSEDRVLDTQLGINKNPARRRDLF